MQAAFGGSTNLLLRVPAIAHAAGLASPTVDDWIAVNRRTPRLVSVLPNGPVHHPTVRVFLAGGVPEVMLHLDRLLPARQTAHHRRLGRAHRTGPPPRDHFIQAAGVRWTPFVGQSGALFKV